MLLNLRSPVKILTVPRVPMPRSFINQPGFHRHHHPGRAVHIELVDRAAGRALPERLPPFDGGRQLHLDRRNLVAVSSFDRRQLILHRHRHLPDHGHGHLDFGRHPRIPDGDRFGRHVRARLFGHLRKRVVAEATQPAPEAREHGLRLAAAALLFEIVRADAEIKEEERTVVRAAIQGTFGLDKDESDELMRLAEEESRGATSLYEFTHLIDKAFSLEQKKRVVELLWLVAFADAEKHAHEEHLVRRIAGLLHVPHPDFIDAKIRARAESESAPGRS